MQTFLPYPSFTESAHSLCRLRLGKQRVEVLQILKAINGESKGWTNHPAVRMWRGHENALVRYGETVCMEWKRRGYKDTCLKKIQSYYDDTQSDDLPEWIDDICSSHRSALLAKNPEHYKQFGWKEEPMDLTLKPLPYYWPE